MGGNGMVSAAAGPKILQVTSTMSSNDVQGIFMTRTSIMTLFMLVAAFLVESTNCAILVFCRTPLRIGNIVAGSLMKSFVLSSLSSYLRARCRSNRTWERRGFTYGDLSRCSSFRSLSNHGGTRSASEAGFLTGRIYIHRCNDFSLRGFAEVNKKHLESCTEVMTSRKTFTAAFSNSITILSGFPLDAS